MQRLAQTMSALTGWRRMAAAFLAGAASVLAMAPYHLWPVMLLTFPLLVWLLDGCFSSPRKGVRVPGDELIAAAWTGWSFGFGYFLAGLYWVGHAFLVEADIFAWLLPFAVTLMPAGLALFYAAAAALAGYLWRPGPARPIALAITLSAAEWLRGHVLTGFPWNVPGYALTGSDAMMQSASLIGVNGLTLVAVLIFASPAVIWAREGMRPAPGYRRLVMPFLMALLVAGGALWGHWRLQSGEIAYVDGVKLRLVQPSIAQRDKWKPEKRAEIFQRLLKASRNGAANGKIEGVTHLIWPESAIPFLLEETPEALDAISAMMPPGSVFITGAARGERAGESGNLKIFNSLFVMDHNARLLRSYDKLHLVPFGEYLPFQEALEAIGLEQLARQRGGFAAGKGSRLTSAPDVPPFISLICYEIIFPGRIRETALGRGAQPGWMLNLTNDAWFGSSAGPDQHFHHARLRAVEEGLPLVRVANNGITAVVGPYGRILSRLPRDAQTALDSRLPGLLGNSIFARWGEFVFGLLWLLTISAWNLFEKYFMY